MTYIAHIFSYNTCSDGLSYAYIFIKMLMTQAADSSMCHGFQVPNPVLSAILLARQKICMFFCGSSATCSPNAALHFLGQCQQLGSERLSLCQTFCLEKCWFASQSKQFNKTCQMSPRPKSRGKCVVHTTYSNVDSSAKF